MIIAFVVGGGISLVSLALDRAPYRETVAKLATIEKTLLDYRRAFYRIPCPARHNVDTNDVNYGYEWIDTATDRCRAAGAGMERDTTNGVYMGALPTRTLGIDDAYMVDGWGRHFSYIIDEKMARVAAFVDYPVDDSNAGAIEILGTNGTITTKAVYAILSVGKSGHGGRTPGGMRIDADSTNAAELENCQCDGDGFYVAMNRTLYQIDLNEKGGASPPFTGYDDVVVFKTRGTMRATNE